jgi:hypothetical protein
MDCIKRLGQTIRKGQCHVTSGTQGQQCPVLWAATPRSRRQRIGQPKRTDEEPLFGLSLFGILFGLVWYWGRICGSLFVGWTLGAIMFDRRDNVKPVLPGGAWGKSKYQRRPAGKRWLPVLYRQRSYLCFWISVAVVLLVTVLAIWKCLGPRSDRFISPPLKEFAIGCPCMFLEANLTLPLNQSMQANHVANTMFLAATEVFERGQHQIVGVFRVRHPMALLRKYDASKDEWMTEWVANSTLATLRLDATKMSEIVPGVARPLVLGSEQLDAVYAYGPEDPRITRCGSTTFVIFHQPDVRAFAPLQRRFQYILDLEKKELYWIDEPRPLTTIGRDAPLVDKNYVPLCMHQKELYVVTSVQPLRMIGPCVLRKDQIFESRADLVVYRASCPIAFSAFVSNTTAFRDSQILRGSTQFVEIVPGQAFVSLVHARRCGVYGRCSYQAAIAVLVRNPLGEWKTAFFPSLLQLYVPGSTQTEPRRSIGKHHPRCLRLREQRDGLHYTLSIKMVENPVSIIRLEPDGSALVSLNVNDKESLIVRVPELQPYAKLVAECILAGQAGVSRIIQDAFVACRNGVFYAFREEAVNNWNKIDKGIASHFRG